MLRPHATPQTALALMFCIILKPTRIRAWAKSKRSRIHRFMTTTSPKTSHFPSEVDDRPLWCPLQQPSSHLYRPSLCLSRTPRTLVGGFWRLECCAGQEPASSQVRGRTPPEKRPSTKILSVQDATGSYLKMRNKRRRASDLIVIRF